MKKLSVSVLAAGVLLTSCHAGRKATGEIPASANRKKIIQTARKYMGTPYRYGGTTPEKGFDCSGFVQYVFSHHGIKLPRSTSGLVNWGKEVPLRRARVADLILFTGSNPSGPVGHVGIITNPNGKDTEFIHAGSSGKNGGVVIGSLANDYFSRRFIKVINVLTD